MFTLNIIKRASKELALTHLVAECPAEVCPSCFQPHAEQLQSTQARSAINRHQAWFDDNGRREAEGLIPHQTESSQDR